MSNLQSNFSTVKEVQIHIRKAHAEDYRRIDTERNVKEINKSVAPLKDVSPQRNEINEY